MGGDTVPYNERGGGGKFRPQIFIFIKVNQMLLLLFSNCNTVIKILLAYQVTLSVLFPEHRSIIRTLI